MNFKFLGKTKTMGILLLGAVAVSSGTMAFASNGADVVHKNVLVSAAPAITDESKADFAKKIASNSGTIEYVKTTHTNMEKDNGDKSFVLEKWYNLKTNEIRDDIKYVSGNSFTNYKSIYTKNNRDMIELQRDKKGNAISGTILHAPAGIKPLKHMSFAEEKNFYLSADWKAEGTEKAADGTELKKVSQSYMSANPKDQQVNTKCVTYLDEVTGLPVKQEVYQEDNGSMKMIWSETLEYNYVNDDGKLFDTNGVKLQEVFQQTK